VNYEPCDEHSKVSAKTFSPTGNGRPNFPQYVGQTNGSNMIVRANYARDAGDYRDAAVLYDEAFRIRPDNAVIHVQYGHTFKEAGDLANVERRYLEADRLTPNDADLALQLGHFYKVAEQLSRSEAA
jgi:tetratricopeptide (TPR) repeat protein